MIAAPSGRGRSAASVVQKWLHMGSMSPSAVWMQTAVLTGPNTAVCIQTAVLGRWAGGDFDAAMPRQDIPRIRRCEQEAAARILGVHEVRFLGLAESAIVQSTDLRRQIVRVIRQVRPTRPVTWSPESNWSRYARAAISTTGQPARSP